MWAAKHCSMLFSTALKRLCDFCCSAIKSPNPNISLVLSLSHVRARALRPPPATGVYFQTFQIVPGTILEHTR